LVPSPQLLYQHFHVLIASVRHPLKLSPMPPHPLLLLANLCLISLSHSNPSIERNSRPKLTAGLANPTSTAVKSTDVTHTVLNPLSPPTPAAPPPSDSMMRCHSRTMSLQC